MDLTNRQVILGLLKKKGFWAQKKLGQNFLICREVLDDILAAAELSSQDMVLEVGPGLGVLTRELCQKAGRVVAVEKDSKMAEVLRETAKEFKNLVIIEEDIFKFKIPINPSPQPSPTRGEGEIRNGYKVVANIPYYLTSHLIQHFLQSDNPPQSMVLMVQKEVAERIVAQPSKMSLLSVIIQFYADAEIVRTVPRTCFWPEPKVDSAIVKIIRKRPPHPNPPPRGGRERVEVKDFFRIVKAGFSGKRKTLANALSGGLQKPKKEIEEALRKLKIDTKRRAETLSLEEWERISEELENG